MPPEQEATAHWRRVRKCFEDAVSLVASERAHYLDSACRGDPALRSEVEELLEHYDRSTGALDTFAGVEIRSSPGLQPDVVVGRRFEILRKLGAGGMGEVYQAFDRELGECVALKRIRPELVFDSKIRERFKHEILNGRRVTHPNVCRIHDLVVDDSAQGAPIAFTMEFLAGQTLADLLQREGRLPIERALPIVRQTVAGLTSLHECDIIHRDLKPANVMLTDESGAAQRVKITDFGLACRDPSGDAFSSLSGSQEIVGTPTYMAPEQLTGERDKVGPATDVYALGLVMYETVTGERPFPGKTIAENVYEKLNERPKHPREHIPDLPESWNNAILHCLEVEPENRPQSPQEVLEALEGIREPPVPPKSKRVFWSDKKLRWGGVAALGLFLALSTQYGRLFVTGEPRQLSVAVLPFGVMGDDPELPAFADGLMATITRRLTQYEGINEDLVVTAPSMVLSLGVADPAAAGKKLGVNYAIEGDLQASGERLVLTLSLVDTDEGHQLDAAMVEGSRENAFALQDGAVRRLVNMLDLQIQPENLDSAEGLTGKALGAAQFYTAGIGYLQRGDVVSNVENAITQFNRALERDPKSPSAHAGLAKAYWLLYDRKGDAWAAEEAAKEARSALDLDEHFQPALVAMGRILVGTGEDEQARDYLSRAVDLDPRDGEAYALLAQSLAKLSRYQQAEVALNRAQSLRPGDWAIYKQAGLFYLRRSRFEEAADNFRTVVQLSPDNAQGWSNLGVALYQDDKIDEARTMFERSVEIEPRPSALTNLGNLAFELSNYAEAAQYFSRAVELSPNTFLLWGNLGAAYKWSNDNRYRETYRKAIGLLKAQIGVRSRRSDLYSYLALYCATIGNSGDARAALRIAAKDLDSLSSTDLVRLGEVYEILGERSRAIALLRTSLAAGYSEQQLYRMPTFQALLASPEWRASSAGFINDSFEEQKHARSNAKGHATKKGNED